MHSHFTDSSIPVTAARGRRAPAAACHHSGWRSSRLGVRWPAWNGYLDEESTSSAVRQNPWLQCCVFLGALLRPARRASPAPVRGAAASSAKAFQFLSPLVNASGAWGLGALRRTSRSDLCCAACAQERAEAEPGGERGGPLCVEALLRLRRIKHLAVGWLVGSSGLPCQWAWCEGQSQHTVLRHSLRFPAVPQQSWRGGSHCSRFAAGAASTDHSHPTPPPSRL
jgi:hypothetical protein